MTKKVAAYSEILYHLINFRTDQFQQLKKMLGIDYDSFMILSVMGAHYLKHSDKLGSDWEAVWKNLRTSKIEEFYIARKLTIYAVANILDLPKETVRRKIETLKKIRNSLSKDLEVSGHFELANANIQSSYDDIPDITISKTTFDLDPNLKRKEIDKLRREKKKFIFILPYNPFESCPFFFNPQISLYIFKRSGKFDFVKKLHKFFFSNLK